MLASAVPLDSLLRSSASVVVITDLDGILRRDDLRTLAGARTALQEFSRTRLVLCSSRGAAELRALQREIGIRQPFISDGGAVLHIPNGYFCGTSADTPDGWETIDFGVRRLGHALRLLVALFRTCPEGPVIVGVGFQWRDRVLLHEVDVPVVIRDAAVDQSALLRTVPNAYLADRTGKTGLASVVFGQGAVGGA